MVALPCVFAIVPAAGSSSRMGLGRSKPFLKIGRCSVIERTLQILLSCAYIERAVVLARAEDLPAFEKLKLDSARIAVIAGGATRRQSVRCGLEYLARHFPHAEQAYVLVHDAARCLVSAELINRTIEAAFEYKAVTTAVPVSDSLKLVNEAGRVEKSVKREGFYAVQTPQVFAFRLLLAAHRQAGEEATDDAALVEAIHPVQVVMGEKTNIKLTSAEDLEIARLLAGAD